MSIDQSTHSLFGVSKTAADLLVQEYGRYFEMPTVCFRGGCLTGPNHAGTQLHGFLSYLMRCTMTGDPYTVFGYGGKQVRDNIHAADLVAAFAAFHRAPRAAAVYNIGGGRQSNCSMLEAIDLCQEIAGRELRWSLGEENRIGDHRWWISDLEPFKRDYPGWDITRDVRRHPERDSRAQRGALGLGSACITRERYPIEHVGRLGIGREAIKPTIEGNNYEKPLTSRSSQRSISCKVISLQIITLLLWQSD